MNIFTSNIDSIDCAYWNIYDGFLAESYLQKILAQVAFDLDKPLH